MQRTMEEGLAERTLTILEMELPAPSRMALMFSQHAFVMSPMLPSTILPEASAGSWPRFHVSIQD